MDKILAIPKNATISCPACGLEIARVGQDIFKGETIKASQFLPIGQEIVNGSEMKCPKCLASYFHFGKFFTKELGFLPKS